MCICGRCFCHAKMLKCLNVAAGLTQRATQAHQCVLVYFHRVTMCVCVCLRPSVQQHGPCFDCSSLAPACVSVKMKVTQTASQSFRPLRPLRPSSLPSWLPSSPSPMTMRRTLGVAMSTRCCQTQMGPLLFTPSMCFLDSLR